MIYAVSRLQPELCAKVPPDNRLAGSREMNGEGWVSYDIILGAGH